MYICAVELETKKKILGVYTTSRMYMLKIQSLIQPNSIYNHEKQYLFNVTLIIIHYQTNTGIIIATTDDT